MKGAESPVRFCRQEAKEFSCMVFAKVSSAIWAANRGYRAGHSAGSQK